MPRPGVPNGDIKGPNGRGLVFRAGTAEAWCSQTRALQDRTAEAWCSRRGHYRTERPRPDVPDGDITGPNGRSLVFPDGDNTGQDGRGLVFRKETFQARAAEAWCPRTGTLHAQIPTRLPTDWHRRLLILLSNTPQIMWCCSGSPVLCFAVVAFVVCHRRRAIFLRGAVNDGRKGQAF